MRIQKISKLQTIKNRGKKVGGRKRKKLSVKRTKK